MTRAPVAAVVNSSSATANVTRDIALSAPSTTSTSEYVAPPRPNLLILACCLAGMTKTLEPHFWDFYPPHAAPFGAGWAEARLLSSIWGVILVVTIIAGGMLGDFYGRRRFLLIGLAMTIAANCAAMITTANHLHIVMHLATLASAALVLPLALAPLYIFYRGRERVMAFAWYILATSVASVFTSSFTHLGMRIFGWRGAYILPLAIGVVALFLIYRNLPESYVYGERHLDAVVYAGWALIVLAVIFGIVQWGFVDEWWAILLVVVAVTGGFGLALIIWWDVNTPGNIFHNTTIRTRDITMLIMIGVVIQLVLMGFTLSTYRYFDVVKGYTLVVRSLAMVPILIGMLVSVRLAPRLWKLQQVSKVTASGLFATGIAIGIMATAPDTTPYLIQTIPLALFGFAIISTKTVWANAFFQTVIDDYIGLNAGINSATLLIGGALGSVLSGELLVAFGYADFAGRLDDFLAQERINELFQLLNRLTELPQVAELLDPTLLGEVVWQSYVASYAYAYANTMRVIAAISMLAAAAIWLLLRRTIRFTSDEVPVDMAASVFEEIPDDIDLLPDELGDLIPDELEELLPGGVGEMLTRDGEEETDEAR